MRAADVRSRKDGVLRVLLHHGGVPRAACRAVRHGQQRHDDADAEADVHAQAQRSDTRRHPHREVHAVEGVVAQGVAVVHQLHHGRDHDARHGEARHVVEDVVGVEHREHHQHAGGGDETGRLRPAPHVGVQRCAREGPSRGHATEERRQDVGQRQRHELLVGVQRVARLGGEAQRDRIRLHVAHERDQRRERHERHRRPGARHERRGRRRQLRRQHAHNGEPERILEVAVVRHQRRGDEQGEVQREPHGHVAPPDEQEGARRHRHAHDDPDAGAGMVLDDGLDDPVQHGHRVVGVRRGQVEASAELRQGDGDGAAGGEAAHDAVVQVRRQVPQSERRHDQAEAARHEGQREREVRRLGRVGVDAALQDGLAREHRQHGDGANAQLARVSTQCVHDGGHGARVEADDGVEVCQVCVGGDLRDGHDEHDDACEEVRPYRLQGAPRQPLCD
eukprot:PhM_4_TR5218/c0_g1_i1/m.103733